jgi:hypothetical protein
MVFFIYHRLGWVWRIAQFQPFGSPLTSRSAALTTEFDGFVENVLLSAEAQFLSTQAVCRKGTLGTTLSAPLGWQRALCREPRQILSLHVCREWDIAISK